ncbi:MAG: hypothetical protein IT379_41665 [Deltaproteobacteria bacterium]|nr:hypothetical protein [Deltaproteobacteria bacterium]
MRPADATTSSHDAERSPAPGPGTEGAHLVGRALLLLARTRATGTVHIDAPSTPGTRLVLTRGVVTAASLGTDGPLVGDLLTRLDALDAERHRDALEHDPAPSGRIGDWLLAAHATTSDALERALLWQTRARFALRLAEATAITFERDAPEPRDVTALARPLPAIDLLLGALRTWNDPHTIDETMARLRGARARLTPSATDTLADALLWPEERAFLDALRTGASVRAALCASGHALRAARFAFAAVTLGLLDVRPTLPGRYALLARKRFELGAHRDARTLLDLDGRANAADARRALRRLARSIHPDTLGPDAHDDLRRAAGEVLGDIANAAERIR